jgi:hypothetical protein
VSGALVLSASVAAGAVESVGTFTGVATIHLLYVRIIHKSYVKTSLSLLASQ